MAASRLDILVSARNQTGGVFNEIKREVSGLESAAKAAGGGLSGFGALLGAGAIVAGLQQIGSALDDVARRGAIFGQLGDVLDDFSASVNSSSKEMIDAGNKAAQGTIANFDLILNANRAIQFEVATTAEQYAKLIELSTALGRAQGISDTLSLEYITTGIARESRLILDNLGLIIDTEAATADYAATIGKTSDQLTQAERKTALLNEAFEQGAVAIAANRDAANSAATQFERLDASATNLRDLLGELIAQGSAEYIKLLADALEYAKEVLEGRERQPEWLTGIGEAAQEAGSSMAATSIQTTVLAQVLRILGQAVVGADLKVIDTQAREASDAFMEMEGITNRAAGALTFAGETANYAAMEARLLGAAALDGADGLSTLESFAWSTASSLDAVGAAMGRAMAAGAQQGALRKQAISQAEAQAMRAIEAGADPATVTQQLGALVDQLWNVGLATDATVESNFENKLMLREVGAETTGVWENIVEVERAAKSAAKNGISEMEKAARETEAAFEDLKGKVSGVLSEALTLDVGVDPGALLKDGVKIEDGQQPQPGDFLLPRADVINEDARRLADVAVKGFESPWYDYFKNEFPALFQEFFAGASSNNDVRAQAAQLLRNFEDGLQPQLLDKEKAKERVKRILLGEQNVAQLAQEIAAELSAEFGNSISVGKIQATANAALGVDEGTGVQLAQTLGGVATDVSGQLATIGSTFRTGIISALNGIGETVALAVDKQFRAENNLKIVAEAGRVNGEAWGSGFLTSMDGLTANVLEKLATLVTPYVETAQQRNATLNGAN